MSSDMEDKSSSSSNSSQEEKNNVNNHTPQDIQEKEINKTSAATTNITTTSTTTSPHPTIPHAINKHGVVDLRKLNEEELRRIRPSDNTLNPFSGLRIDEAHFLDDIGDRNACVKCNKSRKYFCYTCCVPLPCIKERIPSLKLPFKIDIIKHPREIAGKSTAVHAAVLCPDDVTIHTHPALPDYSTHPDDVVLIFPDIAAVSVEEFVRPLHQTSPPPPPAASHKHPRLNLPFTKAVFIDCTWNQTKKIHCDERVRGLRCVELKEHETLFWRYQRGKPKTYLATIEAIYYFLVEVHEATATTPYQGEYDNLLFFFKFMYEKIHLHYDPDCLRAYKDL